MFFVFYLIFFSLFEEEVAVPVGEWWIELVLVSRENY